MSRRDAPYLDTLLRYYEEEIEGEAYFAAMAKRFGDPVRRDAMSLLAQVERHAAEAVAPLLARHGLGARPRDSLCRSGEAQARATPPDWDALMAQMRQSYPVYLAQFEALEAMAPAEDRGRLAFLTRHETAALEFLDLESDGAADALAPLRRYLAARPEAVG